MELYQCKYGEVEFKVARWYNGYFDMDGIKKPVYELNDAELKEIVDSAYYFYYVPLLIDKKREIKLNDYCVVIDSNGFGRIKLNDHPKDLSDYMLNNKCYYTNYKEFDNTTTKKYLNECSYKKIR